METLTITMVGDRHDLLKYLHLLDVKSENDLEIDWTYRFSDDSEECNCSDCGCST